jgi:hypothetical protein
MRDPHVRMYDLRSIADGGPGTVLVPLQMRSAAIAALPRRLRDEVSRGEVPLRLVADRAQRILRKRRFGMLMAAMLCGILALTFAGALLAL